MADPFTLPHQDPDGVPYLIDESMIELHWEDATPEHARLMVEVLNDWGYVTAYGPGNTRASWIPGAPTDADWEDALFVVCDLLEERELNLMTMQSNNADMARKLVVAGHHAQAQVYAQLAVADQLARVAAALEDMQGAYATATFGALPQPQGEMPTNDDSTAEESESSWQHYQQIKAAHQQMIDRNRGLAE